MECKQCTKSGKPQGSCFECKYKPTSPTIFKSISIQPSNTIISQLKEASSSQSASRSIAKIGSINHKGPHFLSTEEFSSYETKDILLGSGSYGNVYLGVNLTDKREYAIKKLNKAIVKEKLGNLLSVSKEIEIHSKLVHPNIIRLHCCYEDSEYFYLIMDNTQQGNLYQLLKRRRQFTEKDAFCYFIQAAKAVYFLHEHNFIHRDIKPENLLLNNDIEVKLCDFGLCNNNSIGNRNTFCGTLEYMAPEILSENSYDKAVDIWSLGILLYELTNGKTPFKINIRNLSSQSHSLTFINQKLSMQCRELIQKMLCLNPKKRITIRGLFEEEIITEFIKATNANQQMNAIKSLNHSANKPVIQSPVLNKTAMYNMVVKERKENNNDNHDSIAFKSTKLFKKTIERPSINNDNASIDYSTNSNLGKINAITTELTANNGINGGYTNRLSQLRKKIANVANVTSDNSKKNSFFLVKKNEEKDNKLMKKQTYGKKNYITFESESSNQVEEQIKTGNFTNNTLLEAIKLVERAKEVKKEIEMPIELINKKEG